MERDAPGPGRKAMGGPELATAEALQAAAAPDHPARALLRLLIDHLEDTVYIKDRDSRFLIANAALAVQNGLPDAEAAVGKTDFDLHPDFLARNFFAREQAMMESGIPIIRMEDPIQAADGKIRWITTDKHPIRDASGTVIGLLGIGRDLTDARKSERLREGHAVIFELILMNASLERVLTQLMLLLEEQMPDTVSSVLMLDADGRHLRHGAAPNLPEAYCAQVDGIEIGPEVASCGTAAYTKRQVIVEDVETDPRWIGYRDLIRPFGLRSCWSNPILSHQGKVLGTFAVYSPEPRRPTQAESHLIDVTTRIAGIAIERKQTLDALQFMASHDPLTGLPDRTRLAALFETACAEAAAAGGIVGLAYLDLDNFKYVNDSLGHAAGDEAMRQIAGALARALGSGGTAVRIGGDEFVLLLRDLPAGVDLVAARLGAVSAAVARPLTVGGRTFQTSMSAGYALWPQDGDDLETLMAAAGNAMRQAKRLGKAGVQRFNEALRRQVADRLTLLHELKRAISRSEFVLHYQPMIDLADGSVFGLEALVRWQHPVEGLLSPDRFIPFAEENGLIVDIGDLVLTEACRTARRLQDRGLPPVTLSVNVSARQFQDADICRSVSQALALTGLDARWVELELTESLLMQDEGRAVDTMNRLAAIGVGLAVDDFGTGYSSLSALKRFPVGRLKIDKSFVRDLARDDDDQTIASTIITMGHRLGMRVIAEGVETEAQLDLLRALGCDEGQGYLFSRPVPAEAAAALVARDARPPIGSLRRKAQVKLSV